MQLRFYLLAGIVVLAACSGEDEPTTASSSSVASSSSSGSGGSGTGGATTSSSSTSSTGGSGGMAAFTVTSSSFAEGMEIPVRHTCDGTNVSPPLSWTGVPAGTMSFAVIHHDLTITFLHSAIWDIPSARSSLPENVANVAEPPEVAGAKQCPSWQANTIGYNGPCPPNQHDYAFDVYALDVATLPNVTTTSSLSEVETEVLAHSLGMARLSGTYTP